MNLIDIDLMKILSNHLDSLKKVRKMDLSDNDCIELYKTSKDFLHFFSKNNEEVVLLNASAACNIFQEYFRFYTSKKISTALTLVADLVKVVPLSILLESKLDFEGFFETLLKESSNLCECWILLTEFLVRVGIYVNLNRRASYESLAISLLLKNNVVLLPYLKDFLIISVQVPFEGLIYSANTIQFLRTYLLKTGVDKRSLNILNSLIEPAAVTMIPKNTVGAKIETFKTIEEVGILAAGNNDVYVTENTPKETSEVQAAKGTLKEQMANTEGDSDSDIPSIIGD